MTRTVLCEYEEDSGFIFAPSMLVEGKSLGTANIDDLSLLQDIVRKKDHNLADFAQARKTGGRVGKRKFTKVQADTQNALQGLIDKLHAGTITDAQFRKQATTQMKRAWRDVFLAGVRASGTRPSGLKGKDDPMVLLGPGDDKWLKSAVRHEMKFFNKFLDATITGDYVMPLERRLGMYMKALESFYDSARIIGMPNNTVIFWLTPGESDRACASCIFLREHSPYTTVNLPTTPRSGATLCLTNCRDWLYIRRVPPSQARKVAEAARYTRGGLIKKLQKIKRTGHP